MLSNRRPVIQVFVLFFCIDLNACTTPTAIQPFTQASQIPQHLTAELKTLTYSSTETPTDIRPSLPQPSDTLDTSQTTNTSTVTTQTILTEQALSFKKTQIANFPSTCTDPNNHFNSLSPKGSWSAISCGYSRVGQTLQLYNKTGLKWEVQFKDYVAQRFITDGQTPPGSLFPLLWTSDEKYLYFISLIGFMGGGPCFYGGSGQGLYRLNIENGSVTATLPPINDADVYSISFSPTGRWLAYSTGLPTIRDLKTGHEIILDKIMEKAGLETLFGRLMVQNYFMEPANHLRFPILKRNLILGSTLYKPVN